MKLIPLAVMAVVLTLSSMEVDAQPTGKCGYGGTSSGSGVSVYRCN